MITRTKLYINGHDAYSDWGLQLDGGDQSGYAVLKGQLTFKEPVVNKNVTAQGAVYVCGAGLVDERTVNVPVHIVANSYTEFKSKSKSFTDYLKYGDPNHHDGKLEIVVTREWQVPGTNKKKEEIEFSSVMICLGINNYTEFSMVQNKSYNEQTDTWTDVAGTGYGIAKFILVLYEPNEPTI